MAAVSVSLGREKRRKLALPNTDGPRTQDAMGKKSDVHKRPNIEMESKLDGGMGGTGQAQWEYPKSKACEPCQGCQGFAAAEAGVP